MDSLKIAMYSHDSVGLGHVRRNLALAGALTEQLPGWTGRPVTGLLITGTPAAPAFPAPPDWDWLLLPGIGKGTGGYLPRSLNMPLREVVGLRSSLLDAALRAFRPDLMIVDRHATGIHGELEPALRRAKAAGTRLVLGLREVLDAPPAALAEWFALGGPPLVRELFDQIWVYGDPSIHDPVSAGEVPSVLGDLIRYSGYLAAGRPAGSAPVEQSEPYLMTTVGGGSDGFELAALSAAMVLPAGVAHLIVAGPQMPEDQVAVLRSLARDGTTVTPRLDDVVGHLRHAQAVVSMGGYNSVCEIMSTSVPALIVPRTQPRAEQVIRARGLAQAGYVDWQDLNTLTPGLLRQWLDGRLGISIDRSRLRLDGLRRVPQLAAVQLQDFCLRSTGGQAAGKVRSTDRAYV